MKTEVMPEDSVAYWAVVPAAGVGRRMGHVIPKQYLALSDSSVIDLTLGRLLSHPMIKGIIVAVSENDAWWPDSRHAFHERIKVVSGGAERCDSVLNALLALQDFADEQDRVLVHDAARPCVRHGDITRLINETGLSASGGLLGVRVRDTMKRTDSGGLIQATLERENMWHAFTPQLFPLGVLINALQDALAQGWRVTDEASAMELAGYQPKMIEGAQDNLKITHPDDLLLADFYLQQQKM
jgi:2-C-methyl-D-erythritol 4-phosphate cytidylyltransferase